MKDGSRITIDGKKHIAIDGDESSALGCKGCIAIDNQKLCEKLPSCYAETRADNRDVIFVLCQS